MDFYISDVTGIQTPYSEEVYRQSLKAEEARALQLAEESEYAISARSQTEKPSNTVDSGQNSSPVTTTTPEGVATGMAGASAARSQSDADAKSISEETEGRPQRRPRQKQLTPVSKVASARALDVERQEVAQEHFPRLGRYANPYWRLDQEQTERKRALHAEQIMSAPVVTLSVKDSASDALAMFKRERFRHVPIISEQKKLVGIISDRSFIGLNDFERPLVDLMKTHIITARPKATIRAIAGLLFKERIGAMPIVDEGGALVGIVTRSDILHAIVQGAPIELWA